MSKIKCTICGKVAEAALSMIDQQEILEVKWLCDCHCDAGDKESNDKDSSYQSILNISKLCLALVDRFVTQNQSFIKLHETMELMNKKNEESPIEELRQAIISMGESLLELSNGLIKQNDNLEQLHVAIAFMNKNIDMMYFLIRDKLKND